MNIFLSIFGILVVANIAAQQTTPSINDRIKQVENNLCPGILYGDTIPKLNLLKQMAAYKVNGLTIAVIKDYKIEWAKGYGWADEGDQRKVTTTTRFQAASISKSLNSFQHFITLLIALHQQITIHCLIRASLTFGLE